MATQVWILIGCLLLPFVNSQYVWTKPDDAECGCVSVNRQFGRLTSNFNEAERSIAILGQSTLELSNLIAEQRQENSLLDKTLVRLKHNSSIVDSKVKAVKQNFNIKQEEILAITRRVDTAKNNLDNLESSDTGRQEVIADLRHSNDVHNEDLKTLSSNDQDIKAGLNRLVNSDTEFAAAIKDQQSKRDTVDSRINDIRRLVKLNQEGIVRVKGNNKQRQAEVAALQDSDRTQDDGIANRQHADEAQTAVISFLQNNANELRGQIDKLSAKDSEIATAINSQQTSDKEIANQLSTAQQSQIAITDSLADIKELDIMVNDNLAGYIHNDTIIQRRIDILKDRDQSAARDRTRIDQRNKAVEVDITALQEQQVTLNARAETLSQSYTVLQQEVAILREQNAAYNDLIISIERNITYFRAYFESVQVRTVTRTTSTLVQTSCARGAPHSAPRESVQLWGSIPALCDTETDGGGWIIIQRRVAGDENFQRPWADYKKGFGKSSSANTDYWLGNELIHNLTVIEGYTQLRIDMKFQGTQKFAKYNSAQVGDEASNYQLSVDGYSGDAGDDLEYHDGMQFSTYDRDNDRSYDSCSEKSGRAGWWYKDCYSVNLNGRWGSNGKDGIYWKSLSLSIPLDSVEIKVRLPSQRLYIPDTIPEMI